MANPGDDIPETTITGGQTGAPSTPGDGTVSVPLSWVFVVVARADGPWAAARVLGVSSVTAEGASNEEVHPVSVGL
jgi:hypothetical protein